jgi:DNA-nicking Smr family endonuclease
MARPRRGVRELTREESELWRAVTATVQPLQGRRLEPPSGPAQLRSASEPDRHLPERSSPAPTHAPKPLSSIDRKLKRELTKGRLEIDARLDLHGLRVPEAHIRVVDFLARAQRDGARIVLIVTGKGSRTTGVFSHESEVGALRRQTPLWLADQRLRHIVAAFGEAAQPHGGQGALYVRIRRR